MSGNRPETETVTSRLVAGLSSTSCMMTRPASPLGVAADSLAPRRVGELTFPIARHFITRSVLVTDEAIRDAQRALWRALQVIAEPGGAAALAAFISRACRPAPPERVAVLLCGANRTAADFDRAS